MLIFYFSAPEKAFSQIADTSRYIVRRDTVLISDTVTKGDTVYIIKKYKIKVYLIERQPINAVYSMDEQPKDTLKNYNPDVSLAGPSLTYKNISSSNFSYFLAFSFLPGYWKRLPKNKLLDTNLTAIFSPNLKLDFSFTYQKNKLATGLLYANFMENFNFEKKILQVDTSIMTVINTQTSWRVDTIWYLNLDSLNNGDTVWEAYYDSTKIIVRDTSYENIFDTTYKTLNYSSLNYYRYFELPIIFGRQFRFAGLELYPQIGVSVGFLFKSKGYFYQTNTYDKQKINKIFELKPVSFNVLLGFEAEKQITDSWRIYAGFSSKYSLTGNFSFQGSNYNFLFCSLNFGVKYKIPVK